MRWIEDRVFNDKAYQEARTSLEEQSEDFLRRYSNNFRNEAEKEYFRRVINSYLTGSFNKSNGEGLSNLLHRSGIEPTTGTRMYVDSKYDEFIKSLVEIHDHFLDAAIVKYDVASQKDLENDRQKEIQMYGSLISGLLANSGRVAEAGERVHVSGFQRAQVKRDEIIPHDKLFESGKQVLKELMAHTEKVITRDLYEELKKELIIRVEVLSKMSNEEYAEEKIELLREAKIKQEAVKGMGR